MNDVFDRVEKKYMLNKEQFTILKNIIDEHLQMDPYHNTVYTISSIYLDTDNFDLIRKSIDKPVYKEKVRLRSYGIPEIDSKVFLEVKKKYDGHGNKRRIKLTLKEAYDFIDKKLSIKSQKANELRYTIDFYNLKSKVYIAYDRLAYQSNNIRVTIDFNIRYKINDLKLESTKNTKRLLDEDIYLMEIKASACYPKWLTEALSKNKLYPNSFSKYGQVYKKLKKEGMI